MESVVNEERKPVWIAFPRIPWGSIGWRMGPGEDYWRVWTAWFKSLSTEVGSAYKSKWPEPDEWKGLYAFIETGAHPPWFLERQRLIAEAAIPPSSQETEITEYHRILWLIRKYMKRIRWEKTTEEEEHAELYVEPEGAQWRLSALKASGMRLTRISASGAQPGVQADRP